MEHSIFYVNMARVKAEKLNFIADNAILHLGDTYIKEAKIEIGTGEILI